MPEIGVVGVGRMAAPMVRRLLDRGWHAHVLDPDPAATAPFRGRADVTVHDDVGALARRAPAVLLSVPGPDALLAVVAQLAADPGAVRTVVSTTTSGPSATREAASRLADVGIAVVDAPVSGGAAGAEQGTLAVLVSGPPDAVTACAPVFDAIAGQVVRIGPEAGQAQVVKLANNLLSLGALAATAEVTALTSAAGVPLPVAIEAFNAGSGRNSATAVKFPAHVLTGRFDFGFPARGALKDVSLFADLAAELGVPAPLASAVVGAWRDAVEQGYGDDDCTHIATLYARLARQDGDA
jgi:3-hydroxyisobutyrate dehydrogenase-like beta-hydroxyacid dehydrogenase